MYIRVLKPHDPRTWAGWSFKEATKGWAEFLRLGIPGAAMLSLEWWAFEIISLFAGALGSAFAMLILRVYDIPFF